MKTYAEGWIEIKKILDEDKIFYYKKGFYNDINLSLLHKIQLNGIVSIYKVINENNSIEIILPKNKNIISPSTVFCCSNFNDHLEELDFQLLLYLFSDKYLDKYLIVKESFAIRKNTISKYHKYDIIYKNGKYIMKNILSKKIKVGRYFRFVYLYIICGILYLNGGNIYYGNKEKIFIIKSICDKNMIEYEIRENYIKILVVNEKNIKQEKIDILKGIYTLLVIINH